MSENKLFVIVIVIVISSFCRFVIHALWYHYIFLMSCASEQVCAKWKRVDISLCHFLFIHTFVFNNSALLNEATVFYLQHMQCVINSAVHFCATPLCFPRYFFQRMQHTDIKVTCTVTMYYFLVYSAAFCEDFYNSGCKSSQVNIGQYTITKSGMQCSLLNS